MAEVAKPHESNITETPYGARARLYRGRRVRMDQLHVEKGAVIGKRHHAEHWTVIFCLNGQVELRIYAPHADYPYMGVVLTTASDPYAIRHGVAYEIVGLMPSAVVIAHGTYHDAVETTASDVVQQGPDLTPEEHLENHWEAKQKSIEKDASNE